MRRSLPSVAVLSGLILLADRLHGDQPVDGARVAVVAATGEVVVLGASYHSAV